MKLLIALVAAAALAAVVGAVFVGSMSFEGTVVDNPYEKGLAYDRERAAREASGLKLEILNPSFSPGGNILALALDDTTGSRVQGLSVKLNLTRPSTTAFDRCYALSARKDGAYVAEIYIPREGHWELRVEVDRETGPVTFVKRIYANPKKIYAKPLERR